MISLRSSALVAILLHATVGQADDAPTFDLKYQFKPGEVVRSEVVHRATVSTTIQGNEQTANTRTTSVKAWKIDGVKPDGTITLTHMVESVDMWHKMQGRQEQRFNSLTDKKPPQGFEDAAKRVAVPLTILTMDPRGKIVKREEKIDKTNTNPTPITLPLPDEAVPIGHEWSVPYTVTSNTANGGVKNIELRQHFTLKSVATGIATIEVETQILTPMSDPAVEAQLIQHMTNGTVKFDIDAGRVVSQVIDLDRRVIGFNGPASSMHYLTRVEEKLLVGTSKAPAPPQTAKKPPVAAKGPVAAKKPPVPAKGPVATKKPPVAPKSPVAVKKPPVAPKGPVAVKKPPVAPKGPVAAKKPPVAPKGPVATKKAPVRLPSTASKPPTTGEPRK